MKSKQTFDNLRKQKVGWFNLKTRLTLVVAIDVFISIMASFGLAILIQKLFPVTVKIPTIIQILLYSLVIATLAIRFVSILFFDPIKKLREAMGKVADGDFSVKLETKSGSKEIQEVYAGFNMMTKELSAIEILQTDFVSNVSHEIKTPINAIEGYTTLLQECESLTENEQEYVSKILFNTKRLSDLVGNILLLSKIENQSIMIKKTKYRLDEQIRGSIVALESKWEEKNIEFDVELDDVEYVGSENLMRHVWDNIIGNAIKFNPIGGEIKIRLYKDSDKIVCTIDDKGPGLTEESIKHIFDKFYQGDVSHKEQGNGLGLALVKRILMICDGDVNAENLTEGGCRFTVILKYLK